MKKVLLLQCLLSLFLSACTEKKNTAERDGLQPITLGIMPSTDGLPFVIAKEKGIYDSLGLEVNLINYFSSTDRDAALQSGNIDGALTDYPSAVILKAKGTELEIIMQNDGYFCFITGKGNGIKNADQLKGKNIAVSSHTVIDYATDRALEQAGLSSEEVNKPEINNIPLRLEMLESGQIAASFFPDPYATIAMSNGHKSITTTQSLNISFTGTAFTGKALKDKKEEIKRLVTGYNQGVAYLLSHPQDEWKDILTGNIGVPESLTGLIVLPAYQLATRPDMKEIQLATAWLRKRGFIAETFHTEHIVDTTFTNIILKPQ